MPRAEGDKNPRASSAPMSEMRLTVTHTGHGSGMECKTPQGQTITFDDPDTGAHGASPVQHLLSAIGACALMDVDIILRKKRLTFTNLRVELVGQRRDDPYPRVFTDVLMRFLVEGDVPEKVFDDTVKLSVDKYCSVAGTVKEGAKVRYEGKVNEK
jgi:putative redox protein